MKICQSKTTFYFQGTRALHFLEALISVSAGRSSPLCLHLNVNQSHFIKNLSKCENGKVYGSVLMTKKSS